MERRTVAVEGKAAQYVRMSTDMQKYSTDNQRAIIGLYAASHGLEIVKTYADDGKSGLNIRGRDGLWRLIQDVRSGNANFGTVLVYDISRWGRFQDVDESAYYEFVCREAGITVRYCAEEFANDGSVAAMIVKSVKRAMAAEYSRELSNRVFQAKCDMTRRGFNHGGRAVFGLRRFVVDERGNPKGVLESGQQKFLALDRTILVPGPTHEIETVRWIFSEFITTDISIRGLAAALNAKGIVNSIGRPWRPNGIRAMLSNEKYIGNNIFNMSSVRLKSRRVRHHPSKWVRADDVFRPILDREIFHRAQARLRSLDRRVTQFELLGHLTALWCKHGKLSATIMQREPTCPVLNTFARSFGAVLAAYEAVGYRRASRRWGHISNRKSIAEQLIEQLRQSGHSAELLGASKQSLLLIDEELVANIVTAHWSYRTRKGKPRWVLGRSVAHRSDLLIIVKKDERATETLDYLIVPDVTSDIATQVLLDRNHLEVDSFRASSLEPLHELLARQDLRKMRLLRRLPRVLKSAGRLPRLPRFSRQHLARKGPHAKRLLRSFQKYAAKMTAFVEKSRRIGSRQRALEGALQRLFCDPHIFRALREEGLDTLPSLTANRVFE